MMGQFVSKKQIKKKRKDQVMYKAPDILSKSDLQLPQNSTEKGEDDLKKKGNLNEEELVTVYGSQIRPQNSNLEFWSRFLEFRERQIRDKHSLCHDGCTTKPTGFDGFEMVVAYNTYKE
jgi:hypothetical protein